MCKSAPFTKSIDPTFCASNEDAAEAQKLLKQHFFAREQGQGNLFATFRAENTYHQQQQPQDPILDAFNQAFNSLYERVHTIQEETSRKQSLESQQLIVEQTKSQSAIKLLKRALGLLDGLGIKYDSRAFDILEDMSNGQATNEAIIIQELIEKAKREETALLENAESPTPEEAPIDSSPLAPIQELDSSKEQSPESDQSADIEQADLV